MRIIFRSLSAAIFLLLLTFAALPTANAQETTAAVQGTVTDPTGAVVPNATVIASSSLVSKAVATTDGHGFYRLNALPPGKYTITVTGSGMAAKATDLNLSAGDLPNLNIKLTTAGTEAVIDVSSSVAMVDVTQSKVETTISNEILQEIPKGRSFQSVIPFAPGARQEPLQSLPTLNGASAPNAAGNANIGGNSSRLNGFQIDGASDAENVYSSDGINITNLQGGGVGFNVPTEFVQDVQVKSSSFEAEFGGALGGVVNVIQARGSNQWHGSAYLYYRSSAMSANDQCLVSTTCGLRYQPGTSANSTARTDAVAQYYNAKQDHYRYVDPGFTIGGPLYKNIWLFASYAPSFARTRRDVTFTTATNGGLHTYYNAQDVQSGFVRLDYAPIEKLRLFGSWQNAYGRTMGALPTPDSKTGQVNSNAGTDPTSFRQDTGFVAPGSVYTSGADYTLNSRTVVSARYGYVFYNSETRGVPSGLRYLYSGSAAATTATLDGSTFGAAGAPSSFFQSSGFNNISANQPTSYNVYTRKQFSADIAYLKNGWGGTHNFKAGYALTNLGNNVKTLYDYANVTVYPGQAETPVTNPAACDAIKAANVSFYAAAGTPLGSAAANACQGRYGYFIVHDGTDVLGNVSSREHALYVEDAWTVGRTGLTINAGVRFDKEYLPPYAAGDPSIGFGFGDKIAPRIGGAYDLLHNGKVKLYASYGKFFDTLKYSLPQGSFGGNYWHDCVYTLDTPNYNLVVPTAPAGGDGYRHSCGVSGTAPGVPGNAVSAVDPGPNPTQAGRFIENIDYRAVNNSSTDPGVDPNVKPMSQHEFVVGAEWAVRPTLSFTSRYARKRLDNTIEDMALNDNYGYYIGNPGSAYGDFLHRAVPNVYATQVAKGALTAAQAAPFLNPQGICPQCPVQPKAVRDYDGIEFRVTKTSAKWFLTAFYTYSRLYGNYPGLTSTNIADGSGGRHNPNNNRSFDLPQMQFTAYGKPFSGPLPTDRPHTFQTYGSYRLKTFFGETGFGFSQQIFSGTPISTCFPTTSSTSACQFVEDQGNFVKYTRDSSGNLVSGGVIHGYRTPVYLQTNLNLKHYVSISKEHENRKMGAEVDIENALNQHAAVAYNDIPLTASATFTASNPTGVDYNALMTPFDYTGLANGGLPNAKPKLILSNQYGLPNTFQSARALRLKIAYIF